MGGRAFFRMARKMSAVMEKLRTKAQYQLAVCFIGVFGSAIEEIVNRLLGVFDGPNSLLIATVVLAAQEDGQIQLSVSGERSDAQLVTNTVNRGACKPVARRPAAWRSINPVAGGNSHEASR